MPLNIIVCYNKNRGIGLSGNIPWHNSEDLQRFKTITTNGIVIMGRKTWDSINKPNGLSGRKNIVLSRNTDLITCSNITVISSIDILDEYIKKNTDNKEIFIIGGEDLYNYYIAKCDKLYISEIDNKQQCDKFFPKIPQIFKLDSYKKKEGIVYYNYVKYNNNQPEKQYLDILQRIMYFGQETIDRTGVGTKSLFAEKMRFNINEQIPVLTTKKVAWKTVIKELLWILKGQTDNKILQDQGVHIWNGNSTKEYLQSIGLPYKEGDLGEVYGFQWRHWGAEYKDCKSDYTNKGIDQISNLIQNIKNDPHSRRHILTAWNVSSLTKMALPPCHMTCQFYVNKNLNTLSCQLYQRSGDMFLGIPFNIMSYSVLTYIIAKLTGYTPGEFIHIIGDAHIYNNHIDQVKKQLERKPLAFPKLILSNFNDINDLNISHFDLIGYNSHGTLKADMAI